MTNDAKEKYLSCWSAEQTRRTPAIRRGEHRHARSRILIKAADGSTDEEIVRALGVGVATIERLRKRFEERGLDGLNDLPRPGTNQFSTRRPKRD